MAVGWWWFTWLLASISAIPSLVIGELVTTGGGIEGARLLGIFESITTAIYAICLVFWIMLVRGLTKAQYDLAARHEAPIHEDPTVRQFTVASGSRSARRDGLPGLPL